MTTTDALASRESLAWGSALLDPALRAAVDVLSPATRRVCGYHLGWWDDRERPTWSESEADIQRNRALEQLDGARFEPGAVAEPLALADLVTSRDR